MELGKNQITMLQCLADYGYWCDGHSGWLWDTPSGTVRILESLTKRALVSKTFIEQYARFKYQITAAGRQVLEH